MTLDIRARTLRAVAARRPGLRRLHDRSHDDRGQATTEYGLVILVAGAIALGVIAWAGGTGAFTDENVPCTCYSVRTGPSARRPGHPRTRRCRLRALASPAHPGHRRRRR